MRAYVCSKLSSVSRAGECISEWYTSENICSLLVTSGGA